MINKDRIVPIQKADYLSMIYTILQLALEIKQSTTDVIYIAEGEAGNYDIPHYSDSNEAYIVPEPVKSLRFHAESEDDMFPHVYFVASPEYTGATAEINGEIRELSTTTKIAKDGVSLYVSEGDVGSFDVRPMSPFPNEPEDPDDPDDPGVG